VKRNPSQPPNAVPPATGGIGPAAGASSDGARALETIKALLGELHDPRRTSDVPFIILRFAHGFFARGVVFLFHEERGELAGAAAFGLAVADPGRIAQAIRIPVAADTVFSRALRESTSIRQPFFASEWNQMLAMMLGGPQPKEVFVAALACPRGTIGVLYADNAIDDRPFPDVELLDVFFQQASPAIERFLADRQRKLPARDRS